MTSRKQGMQMILPDFVTKLLREIGYTDAQNIGEFWHKNEAAISRVLSGSHPLEFNRWTEQLRWTTPLGQACQAAVRKHIDEHREHLHKVRNAICNADKAGSFSAQLMNHPARRLSFDRFTFEFNGKAWTLDDFQKLGRSQRYPDANLTGIDLSGIRLVDCEVWNVCLASAILDGAYISQVTLNQTTLTGASIRNARIVSVRVNHGSLTECDVSGSFINAVDFTNEVISSDMRYAPVSYWFLIKRLWLAIFSAKHPLMQQSENNRHTTFLFNRTIGLTLPETRPFKAYVDWFQFVGQQTVNFRNLPIRQKLGFASSLLLTKAWTSYSVLACWGMAANIAFATFYYVNRSSFKGLEVGNFINALYFSFITFTTVGYGDITPATTLSQVVVMVEIILGYLTLGCMVFLIGHKVAHRF